MPPRPYNLIQNPELQRAIQVALGMHQAAPAPTLAETVQPVVVVADTSLGPQAPPRELCVGRMTTQLVGTQFDYAFMLYMPATSNVLARLVSWEARAIGEEQDVDFGYGQTGQVDIAYAGHSAQGSITRFADFRKSHPPGMLSLTLPQLQLRHFRVDGAISIPQYALGRFFLPMGLPGTAVPGGVWSEPRELLIPPGYALIFTNSAPLAVGSGAMVAVSWTEEPADTGVRP